VLPCPAQNKQALPHPHSLVTGTIGTYSNRSPAPSDIQMILQEMHAVTGIGLAVPSQMPARAERERVVPPKHYHHHHHYGRQQQSLVPARSRCTKSKCVTMDGVVSQQPVLASCSVLQRHSTASPPTFSTAFA
jgi:hypothetical protein